MRPYYRTLHELTNELLVEHRDFITIKLIEEKPSYNMRVYNKHDFLLIAMLCKKHGRRNWLDNQRLMGDHKTYINRKTGITASKIVEDSSDDSE